MSSPAGSTSAELGSYPRDVTDPSGTFATPRVAAGALYLDGTGCVLGCVLLVHPHLQRHLGQVVVSRVGAAHRVSDAAGALYSAGAAWTINGRGASYYSAGIDGGSSGCLTTL